MGKIKYIDKQPDGSYIESDNLFDHAIYSGSGKSYIPAWRVFLFAFGVMAILLGLLGLVILVCDILNKA